MEVKEGYKQTEIGIIPIEWSVRLMKTFSLSSAFGPRFSGEHYHKDGNIATLRTTDLDDDGNINYQSMPLAKLDENVFKKHLLKPNDFLITRSGTCGIATVFESFDKPVLPGAFLIRFRFDGSVSAEFIRYYVNSEFGKNRLEQIILGAVQKNISGSSLLNTLFPIPPLSEQRAIATALSDVDRLLSAYDQLIAKKKAIKQGAMQELLTGRRRLEGFEGEWKPKTLGQVAKFFSGGTPNTSIPEYYKGGPEIPWITSSDLNQGRITNVDGRITKLGLDNSSAQLVKNGTLLLALYGATAGVAAVSEIPAAINQAVLAIIPFDDNSEFLYQKFQLIREWLITTYTQGGQPNLSGQIIKSIELTFPTPAEQHAIARILTDMDAEIAALEQQREKYKAVKAGMMQELLTGKTRLV